MNQFDSPAAKVLAVLAEVARTREAAVTTLADSLELPVSTVHRIASELERLGYLQRAPGSRSWTVASPSIELAAEVLTAGAALAKPQAILREISDRVGEICSFAIQRGNEVVYAASAEPHQELTLSFRTGRTAPLYCTSSGRLFLARYEEQDLDRYLDGIVLRPFTPATVTDPRRLKAIVRRARIQGYTVTSQEYVPHIVGAAVPVVGSDGVMYGTLGVTAPEVRTGAARMRTFIPDMRAAAARLAAFFQPRPATLEGLRRVRLARSA